MAKNNPKDKSLESWIWDAACSIRGAQEAPKYKDFILPLIFAKRLCDVFDDEVNRIAEGEGNVALPELGKHLAMLLDSTRQNKIFEKCIYCRREDGIFARPVKTTAR